MQLLPRFDNTGLIQSWRETPEGFLDVHMTFSKCGPLVYRRADGSLETEYLSEEELFDDDSLSTATHKPVTYLHPPGMLTKANARQYARGSTGTKVIRDSPFATIVATIHDHELIDVIKSGQAKQVSAGYLARTERRDGKLYQKGRVYNHLAVVPEGRAGADVKVHFDGIDLGYSQQQYADKAREDIARDLYIARLQRRDAVAPVLTEEEARSQYIQRLTKRR